MAHNNTINLLGYVSSIMISKGLTGAPYAVCYIAVGRANRATGDGKRHMPVRQVLVMTNEAEKVREMKDWTEYDVVEIKGALTTQSLKKKSHCPNCNLEYANIGTIVYVTPIFAKKRYHLNSVEECNAFISENREVSNVAYILGNVCTTPKRLESKAGLTVTQYQIAIGRKYYIRNDDPLNKTDFPWVKSYGKNAVDDKDRIRVGSEVLIDGCLQTRRVKRKNGFCTVCNQAYDWIDHAMEIVPYTSEYLYNFNTDEEIEEQKREAARQMTTEVRSILAGNHLPPDKMTEAEMQEQAFEL